MIIWQVRVAIILHYKCPGIICLALPARCKVLKLDFQSNYSMSKINRIFLFIFSLRNKILGAHFLLKWSFGNFNFKTTSLLKSGPIFDQAAKLVKAFRDALYPGLWLILQYLLQNWVADSDVNDFTPNCPASPKQVPILKILIKRVHYRTFFLKDFGCASVPALISLL